MRWQSGRRSENVEDRRGQRPMMMMGGGGMGILILALLVWFLGGNPLQVLQMGGQQRQQAPPGGAATPDDPRQAELKEFVSVVLADTEDVWHRVLAEQKRKDYVEPNLVLFTGQVQSACGFASAAMGPFYCPGDSKVYLDMSFFDQMEQELGADGDFAQAYVIAHEVGHHVQNLLGISSEVHRLQQAMGEAEANELSVRLELQADFFAGVWAHHAQRMRNILEDGDIEEALRCAEAIGDDRLQKRSRGYVVPDSFTHGTSEQRARWFRKGLQTGSIGQGDTFNARDL
jgi:predicted metalloprotease